MAVERVQGDGVAYWDQRQQEALELVRTAPRSLVVYVEAADGDLISLTLLRTPTGEMAAEMMAAVARNAVDAMNELLELAVQEGE